MEIGGEAQMYTAAAVFTVVLAWMRTWFYPSSITQMTTAAPEALPQKNIIVEEEETAVTSKKPVARSTVLPSAIRPWGQPEAHKYVWEIEAEARADAEQAFLQQYKPPPMRAHPTKEKIADEKPQSEAVARLDDKAKEVDRHSAAGPPAPAPQPKPPQKPAKIAGDAGASRASRSRKISAKANGLPLSPEQKVTRVCRTSLEKRRESQTRRRMKERKANKAIIAELCSGFRTLTIQGPVTTRRTTSRYNSYLPLALLSKAIFQRYCRPSSLNDEFKTGIFEEKKEIEVSNSYENEKMEEDEKPAAASAQLQDSTERMEEDEKPAVADAQLHKGEEMEEDEQLSVSDVPLNENMDTDDDMITPAIPHAATPQTPAAPERAVAPMTTTSNHTPAPSVPSLSTNPQAGFVAHNPTLHSSTPTNGLPAVPLGFAAPKRNTGSSFTMTPSDSPSILQKTPTAPLPNLDAFNQKTPTTSLPGLTALNQPTNSNTGANPLTVVPAELPALNSGFASSTLAQTQQKPSNNSSTMIAQIGDGISAPFTGQSTPSFAQTAAPQVPVAPSTSTQVAPPQLPKPSTPVGVQPYAGQQYYEAPKRNAGTPFSLAPITWAAASVQTHSNTAQERSNVLVNPPTKFDNKTASNASGLGQSGSGNSDSDLLSKDGGRDQAKRKVSNRNAGDKEAPALFAEDKLQRHNDELASGNMDRLGSSTGTSHIKPNPAVTRTDGGQSKLSKLGVSPFMPKKPSPLSRTQTPSSTKTPASTSPSAAPYNIASKSSSGGASHGSTATPATVGTSYRPGSFGSGSFTSMPSGTNKKASYQPDPYGAGSFTSIPYPKNSTTSYQPGLYGGGSFTSIPYPTTSTTSYQADLYGGPFRGVTASPANEANSYQSDPYSGQPLTSPYEGPAAVSTTKLDLTEELKAGLGGKLTKTRASSIIRSWRGKMQRDVRDIRHVVTLDEWARQKCKNDADVKAEEKSRWNTVFMDGTHALKVSEAGSAAENIYAFLDALCNDQSREDAAEIVGGAPVTAQFWSSALETFRSGYQMHKEMDNYPKSPVERGLKALAKLFKLWASLEEAK